MQNGGCHPVDGCQDGTPFFGVAVPVPRRERAATRHAARRSCRPTRSRRSAARQDRVHRPDPRGHAADRHAGGRRRASSSSTRSTTINKLVDDACSRTKGVQRDRRPDPRGRPAERAVRERLHGHQRLRQLHRRDQADRRGARSRRSTSSSRRTRTRRTSALRRQAVDQRGVVRPPDHGHRPDARPQDAGRRRRSRRTTAIVTRDVPKDPAITR